MDRDPLPNEQQRQALCELIHNAFIELRSIYDQPEQVHDLAYALHNLPMEIYGWGVWSIEGTRGRLRRYRDRYPETPDYVEMFDRIFPEADSPGKPL